MHPPAGGSVIEQVPSRSPAGPARILKFIQGVVMRRDSTRRKDAKAVERHRHPVSHEGDAASRPAAGRERQATRDRDSLHMTFRDLFAAATDDAGMACRSRPRDRGRVTGTNRRCLSARRTLLATSRRSSRPQREPGHSTPIQPSSVAATWRARVAPHGVRMSEGRSCRRDAAPQRRRYRGASASSRQPAAMLRRCGSHMCPSIVAGLALTVITS